VQLHEFPGEAQAEPGAAELAGDRGVRLPELREDVVELVLRDPDPRIRHGIQEPIVLSLDLNQHPPARGELDRIPRQV
jgi:hypothetical protein